MIMKVRYETKDEQAAMGMAHTLLFAALGREANMVDLPGIKAEEVDGVGPFPSKVDAIEGWRGDEIPPQELRQDLLRGAEDGVRVAAMNSEATLNKHKGDFTGVRYTLEIDGLRGSIYDVFADVLDGCEEHSEIKRTTYQTSSPWLGVRERTKDALHRLVDKIDREGFTADSDHQAAALLRDRLATLVDEGELNTESVRAVDSAREAAADVGFDAPTGNGPVVHTVSREGGQS